MSNLGPMAGRRSPMLPTMPTGQTIARYPTYEQAQRAVDFLSDNQFPVQFVTIVGTDLRMVERVTGRLSYGRVALGGAASGAYFGLFVGILLLFFSPGGAEFGVLFAVLIGAGFGMLFGITSYAFTRGRRDFTSQSQIVASEYQVLCHDEQVRAAVEVLGNLAAGGGRPGPAPQGQAPWTAPPPDQQPPLPASPPSRTAPPASPTAEAPAPPVTGPTYGEMIAKKRREKAEQDKAEQDKAERSQAQPPQDG